MGLHDKLALIFTSSAVVLDAVNNLAILLAFTILLNSIQPVLSGTLPRPSSTSSVIWPNPSITGHCQPMSRTHSIWSCSAETNAGVAVGSGWQSAVAYVNIGSYYLIGVPMGVLLGWLFNLGVLVRAASSTSLSSWVVAVVAFTLRSRRRTDDFCVRNLLQGIWAGMIGGTAVQTLILAIMTIRCDWEKEVSERAC